MGEISDALKRARDGALQTPGFAPGRDRLEPLVVPPRDATTAQSISSEQAGDWHSRCVLVDPRSGHAESYRHFAIRLQRAMKERGARSVVVTSAARGEGKTTTACNLALASASMASGRRIALVEFDLRRPALAGALGIASQIGIDKILRGQATVSEACIHTQLADLDVYLGGPPSANPLDAISSPKTTAFLRELARQYDLIIVDAPPVLPVPDVPMLIASVDAALLVARSGMSRRAAVREAVEVLGGAKIVGAFLNEATTPRHRRYSGYYGYGEPASPKEGAR